MQVAVLYLLISSVSIFWSIWTFHSSALSFPHNIFIGSNIELISKKLSSSEHENSEDVYGATVDLPTAHDTFEDLYDTPDNLSVLHGISEDVHSTSVDLSTAYDTCEDVRDTSDNLPVAHDITKDVPSTFED